MSVTLARTGDTSGRILIYGKDYYTTHLPPPQNQETSTDPSLPKRYIPPGETSFAIEFHRLLHVSALGRSHRYVLDNPHYCPDDPAECGYGPQYTVGTPQEATVQMHSNFMGVRIEADQSTVPEGGAAAFTLHRHGGKPGAMARPLQVMVEVTQDGDYISGTAPETVTFQADQATAALSVPTSDDSTDEADGAITVKILEAASYADDEYAYETRRYVDTPWVIDSATTAVTDDDYALPNISISDYEVDEDQGMFIFTISLDRPNHQRPVSFDWITQDDGSSNAATGGADYQTASSSFTFSAGQTSQQFGFAITNDTEPEPDETFSIVLSYLSEASPGDTTGTVTIHDDDLDYGITISDISDDVEEGNEITFTLQRMASTAPTGSEQAQAPCFRHGGQAVTCFDPQAAPGNAPLTIYLEITQSGDFVSTALPATVTFAPGDRFAIVRVPTDDDSHVEATGVLTVHILNGQGYSPEFTRAVSTGTVNIHDNDLTFSIDDAQATEAAGATMDFTVSLNAPAPEQVTVEAATSDGEATSHGSVTATSLGRDFEARTEAIIFEVGEQQKTFSVDLVDDSFQERDETFPVQLSGQPLYSSLVDDNGTGTILDDEQAMVVSVSRTYAIVNEDHPGPVRFTVELTHPDTTASERNPAVGWEIVAGTATEGEDYQAAGGKLSFPVGSTSGFIEVDLLDDNLFEEALETFTVRLTQQDTRLLTISPTDSSFETSIRNNETLSAAITATARFVAEGDDAGFTVTLTGGVTTEAVRVDFETAGDAEPEEDYGAPTGSLSFPPGDSSGKTGALTIPAGQTSGTITYPILTDSVEDDDETLEVEIFNVYSASRSAMVPPDQAMASTTILDEGSLTVSIQGSPSVDEGTAATFTVALSKPSDENVTADWTTRQVSDPLDPGETAKPGEDYAIATGTVSIPAGSTSATFTVSTTEDTLVEGDETFWVELDEARFTSTSPPEIVPLGITLAAGTILDDDTAPGGLTVSATPTRMTEDAGATDVSVTVTLDGTAQLTVDTPVTVEFINRPNVNGNATPGEEYTATPVNTVIPAGQSSVTATITITPADDSIAEDDEIARLSVKSSALTGSNGLGVTIEDNDTEPVEVVLTVSPDTLDETSGLTPLHVTASLVGQTSRQVDTVVTVTTGSGTATGGEDFETATITLTILAGEMSTAGTLDFTVTDDTAHEGDETLELSGSAPGLMVTGAEVTIRDDDTAPTSISLSVTSSPITEDGAAVILPVQATLLGGGTRPEDTTVALRLVDLNATVTDDYAAAWGTTSLTIPAGEFSASTTLTITPVQDTFHEETESIAVRGLNTDPGLPVNGVRINIQDDDPAPAQVRLEVDPGSISESSGSVLADVNAILVGDSTLTTDTQITTNLVSSDPLSRVGGGSLLLPLEIEAGESSGKSILVLLNLNDYVDDPDEILELRGTASNPDLMVLPGQVVIQDDDTAGVKVSPTSLNVQEGQARRYTVNLDSEPTADVTVTVDVPAGAGFTVSPGTLTFTSQNWSSVQRVTVSALEDPNARDEPTATITHSVSSTDTLYDGVSTDSVAVIVTDDDTAGVSISEVSLDFEEGDNGTYTVVLNTEPLGDVTVTAGGVADTDLSLDKTTLTFTDQNWDTPQEIAVTAGQDDDAVDEPEVTITHTVTSTDDSGYDGVNPDGVKVTVTDDDTAGVTVNPTAITVVGGRSNEYAVVLNSEPVADVTVTLDEYSNKALNVDKELLTFTDQDWDTAKTVTVTADADAAPDTVTLTHSVKSADDSEYDGVSADSVSVTILKAPSGPLVQVGLAASDHELTVPEGESKTYSIVLSSLPVGDVTVAIGGFADTDISLDMTPLTFTTQNWNVNQTVTVTAGQDGDAVDDTVTVTHAISSVDDSNYDGLSAPSVVVTVTDDEVVGVTVDPTTLPIEEGDSGTYTVVLDSQPAGDVTVTIEGIANTDLSLDNTTLTFTDQDWNTAQEVTVTAEHDDEAVDEAVVTISHTLSSTADSAYDGATAVGIPVTVTDDDTVGVTISETALTIGEGDSATYTVVLDTLPSANVTVTVNVQNGAELMVTPQSLIFTDQNWDAAQTVTINALDDTDTADEATVTLTHSVAGALEYSAVIPSPK